MAKKENDENKDVNQDPEEDFGLPDLEFEELDDIDEDGDDNLEEEIAEIMGDSSEDEGEAMQDIGASEDDADQVTAETGTDEGLGDIGISSDEETSTDDVGQDSGDELDEVEKFISEITADDEGEETADTAEEEVGSELDDITSDETEEIGDLGTTEMFGSVEEEESSDDGEEFQYSYDDDEDGGTSSSFTRIIIFGLVGAVVAAFAFLYFSDGDSAEQQAAAETPVVTEPEPAQEEPVAEDQPAEDTPAPAAQEEPAQEEAPPRQTQAQVPVSTGTPGEITTISASAGRYYIVVASFIDDDMAKDHANDLASQGASVKIVEPFNERKFYRVSVADYGSRSEAVSATEQLKSQYGDDIWALKY